MAEAESAVLGRDGRAHGERAQGVACAADCQQEEEAEAYLEERVEDGLDADAVDDIDEKHQAQEEGDGLKPDDVAAKAAPAGHSLLASLVRHFILVEPVKARHLLVYRLQGAVATPSATGWPLRSRSVSPKTSLMMRPGKRRKPRSQRTGTGFCPSFNCPVSASTVGMKLRLS